MNNKGFTLAELLATIFIIGIVMGIATTSIISTINKSKEKSEKIFVDKLATAIESYISVNGSQRIVISEAEILFTKCRKVDVNGDCSSSEYSKYAKDVTAFELQSFKLKDITEGDTKTISIDDVINPKNKTKCLNDGKNPEVRLFKDSDYVYYYYVDLSGDYTSCDIGEENSILTNIPEKLCESLMLDDFYKDNIKCDESEE